jgi:hypothetical protein
VRGKKEEKRAKERKRVKEEKERNGKGGWEGPPFLWGVV